MVGDHPFVANFLIVIIFLLRKIILLIMFCCFWGVCPLFHLVSIVCCLIERKRRLQPSFLYWGMLSLGKGEGISVSLPISLLVESLTL